MAGFSGDQIDGVEGVEVAAAAEEDAGFAEDAEVLRGWGGKGFPMGNGSMLKSLRQWREAVSFRGSWNSWIVSQWRLGSVVEGLAFAGIGCGLAMCWI